LLKVKKKNSTSRPNCHKLEDFKEPDPNFCWDFNNEAPKTLLF